MSWRRARLCAFSLPLVRPLELSSGPLQARLGWLVRLEDDTGHVGLGTAMPIAGFGGEGFEACGQALARALASEAEAGRGTTGVATAPSIDARRSPFAASALALARLDLDARRCGLALAEALGSPSASIAPSVPVNALLAGDDEHALRDRVRAYAAYPVLKLKVGADVDRALACIDVVCDAMAAGQRLRIDPNARWSEVGAARALAALADHPIDYVEQPVASLGALARLRSASPVALAADESASDAGGVRAVIDRKAADVIVSKPMRAGGPRVAVALAAEARGAGLDVVVTSLLDSAIGVRAALAVAQTLGPAVRACGLDTAGLFEADLVSAPSVSGGRMHGCSAPGLGVDVDEAALDTLARGPERTWAR